MNRLKDGSAPMPVNVVHARIAFREAVAVVRLACDVYQQFFHRLVKVFVVTAGLFLPNPSKRFNWPHYGPSSSVSVIKCRQKSSF